MRLLWTAVAVAAAVAALVTVTSGSGGERRPATGTLTWLHAGQVETLDPGAANDFSDWPILYAVHRALYVPSPHDGRPIPDLAAGQPDISPDRRRVTVRLRRDARFGPPVNRRIVAEDVEYAIERAVSAATLNGAALTYFRHLAGLPRRPGPVRDLPGVEAIGSDTLVLRLRRPVAVAVSAALVLPAAMPVPRELARRLDRSKPSRYGRRVVFSGPYLARTRKRGVRLDLMANPAWTAVRDSAPSRIVVRESAGDPAIAARQVLQGRRMLGGPLPLPGPVAAAARRRRPDQLDGGNPANFEYLGLNTLAEPFDDVHVRRAVAAVVDRATILKLIGGPLGGDAATHVLPPGFPGHDAAGGRRGPDLDWLGSAGGSPEVARAHLRRAGFPNGRYHGPPLRLLVPSEQPMRGAMEVIAHDLQSIGFRLETRLVAAQALGMRCSQRKERVPLCPGSWTADFRDGTAMLVGPFSGATARQSPSFNFARVDDPQVDAAIARAELLPPGRRRDRAWARVDRAVMATAAVVPLTWSRIGRVRSPDVRSVVNPVTGQWDLRATRLRRAVPLP